MQYSGFANVLLIFLIVLRKTHDEVGIVKKKYFSYTSIIGTFKYTIQYKI